MFILLIHGLRPETFGRNVYLRDAHMQMPLPCVWYKCPWHHKYKVWENGIVSAFAIVRENLNQGPKCALETDASYPFQNQYRSNIRQPPTRTPVEKVALLRRNLLQSLREQKYPRGSP